MTGFCRFLTCARIWNDIAVFWHFAFQSQRFECLDGEVFVPAVIILSINIILTAASCSALLLALGCFAFDVLPSNQSPHEYHISSTWYKITSTSLAFNFTLCSHPDPIEINVDKNGFWARCHVANNCRDALDNKGVQPEMFAKYFTTLLLHRPHLTALHPDTRRNSTLWAMSERALLAF